MQHNKMTKLLIKILVILLFTFLKVSGQTINDSTLSVNYNRLLEWTLHSDKNDSDIFRFLIQENNKFGNIFICTDFNKELLVKKINPLNIQYINNHEDELKIINDNKGDQNKRLFLWINHENISADTIDIVITGRFLIVKKGLTIRKGHLKFKTYSLKGIYNTGISGRLKKGWFYSIGRLIYNYHDNSWGFYTWDRLLDVDNE